MRRWCLAKRLTPLITSTSNVKRLNHHLLAAQGQKISQNEFPLTQPSPIPKSHQPTPRTRDPYAFLAPQLTHISTSLISLLGSSHPSLSTIAEYYFLQPSKQLRPLLVLLFAHATNGLGKGWHIKHWLAQHEHASEQLDHPLSRMDVLNDYNPSMPDHTSSFATVFPLQPQQPPRKPHPPPPPRTAGPPEVAGTLLPTQLRLAQLVEMIHVASLLHDDVIDESPLRRGAPSAPNAFGSKLSVLGGDFLLGRASTALSRLGDVEVVELISSVISNLVEGEVLQIRDDLGKTEGSSKSTANAVQALKGPTQERWNWYLKKTYLKTASLMAKGARSAVVLGGCKEGEIWKEAAYAYGRNLGIAFQLVDDILDYTSAPSPIPSPQPQSPAPFSPSAPSPSPSPTPSTLGKPANADLALGLATGPALFAWEEHPEMGELIDRKFEREGDVAWARDLVARSSGVERTRALARVHAEQAKHVLAVLPDSEAKSALEALAERVVERTF